MTITIGFGRYSDSTLDNRLSKELEIIVWWLGAAVSWNRHDTQRSYSLFHSRDWFAGIRNLRYINEMFS